MPENTKEQASVKLDRELHERLPLKTLLVKDDENSRKFLAETLAGMGYPAEMADDGAEAVEQVKNPVRHGADGSADAESGRLPGNRRDSEHQKTGPPHHYRRYRECSAGGAGKCLAAGMSNFIRKPVDIGGLQET